MMLKLFDSPKEWAKFLCCLGAAIIGMGIIDSTVQLVVNQSESLPYKYFVRLGHKTPHQGDYTLLKSDWYGTRLIKRVIGVAGDRVFYTNDGELMVGEICVGKPRTLSTDGRNLTPIREQTIPEGKVFVYAPHELSFDSRYEELNLVSTDDLQGTAYPLKFGEKLS